MFLLIMVLMPQKFTIYFTLGCIFIIGSFFSLKGPHIQFTDMTSKERLPFIVGFIGSMVGTLYVSMVLALSYYAISNFLGGSTGMKILSSNSISSILKCFGRRH
ncbi:hypothetical protein GIB67_029440 [Kingdonia uniflora]|uniref:Vesicle transport protein n=1 Tax=Kingdonia uniflora TaxID=39325 RepID=A0A7J7NYF7_9MAGN|nr:hypothetical protein GIB67_029440 [Kingdonia uniflora]